LSSSPVSNGGLVALADFDLVATLTGQKCGQTNKASKLAYGLVGAAALYQVAQIGGILWRWSDNPSAATELDVSPTDVVHQLS
jgi:uncharacterized membrane protein YuzA (DUF378 family)